MCYNKNPELPSKPCGTEANPNLNLQEWKDYLTKDFLWKKGQIPPGTLDIPLALKDIEAATSCKELKQFVTNSITKLKEKVKEKVGPTYRFVRDNLEDLAKALNANQEQLNRLRARGTPSVYNPELGKAEPPQKLIFKLVSQSPIKQSFTLKPGELLVVGLVNFGTSFQVSSQAPTVLTIIAQKTLAGIDYLGEFLYSFTGINLIKLNFMLGGKSIDKVDVTLINAGKKFLTIKAISPERLLFDSSSLVHTDDFKPVFTTGFCKFRTVGDGDESQEAMDKLAQEHADIAIAHAKAKGYSKFLEQYPAGTHRIYSEDAGYEFIMDVHATGGWPFRYLTIRITIKNRFCGYDENGDPVVQPADHTGSGVAVW